MAEELKNQAAAMDDPFAIFNTKVEEITSYEESEKRDWSKTFLELEAGENGKDSVCLVKLCLNVFNPKDSLPKRYTYKLPYPDNPSSTYNFLSPSTIGHKCPVMDLWFKLKGEEKKGDTVAGQKAKNLSRKRYRAVMVQIIQYIAHPELNGQFRILRFPEGMDIDNLIASKINPSEEERQIGAEPVNVFDPFESPLLILRCGKGSVGRDFSKSSWAPEKQAHGNLVPDKRDDKGNILSYRPLTKADMADQAKAREYLVWLMDELKKPEISLQEQWMYKEPDEKTLDQVRKSLELIETGSYNPTPAENKEDDKNSGAEALKQEAKPETTASQEATPAAPANPTQEPAPTETKAEDPKPAATSESAADTDDAALMKELGLS